MRAGQGSVRAVAGPLLAAAALTGCGGGEMRTVTVRETPAAGPRDRSPATLSRVQSARVARARGALSDYCDAVRSGRDGDEDAEASALAVLATVFVRNPSARFSTSDSPLALAEVLKAEASALDEGDCDPRGARLLRRLVDVVLTGRAR